MRCEHAKMLSLWRVLGPPVRPTAEFVQAVGHAAAIRQHVLILGATSELVLAARSVDATVTVVDQSAAALSCMTSFCRYEAVNVEMVEANWFEFLTSAAQQYDLVLTDGGLLFIAPTSIPELLQLISQCLRRTTGAFLGRHCVVGDPGECRSLWRKAIRARPSRSTVSSLYVANMLIACRYGRTCVSYPRLQRLACRMLEAWRRSWPAQDWSHFAEHVTDFIARDMALYDTTPRLRGPISLHQLSEAIDSCFATARVIRSNCCLPSFYRIVHAEGAK